MIVSGWATTFNEPFVTDASMDVPFNLPPGGDAARIDIAVVKVSLNGNLLAAADYEVTVDPTLHFIVTNKSADPWPAVSSVVVEADYAPTLDDDPAQFGPNDWLEVIKNASAPPPPVVP